MTTDFTERLLARRIVSSRGATARTSTGVAEPTVLRPRSARPDTAMRPRHEAAIDDCECTPILERLERMAVSASRVVDDRSIPGAVLLDVDGDIWRTAIAPGYLRLYIADHGGDGTIAVVLTRFVVDHGADVSDLLDHAFVEARALPEWQEDNADREQAGFRTEGATAQTGTYRSDDETWFCTIRYAAYRRGNVAYLLHATGSAPVREGHDFRRAIAAAVRTVRFED